MAEQNEPIWNLTQNPELSAEVLTRKNLDGSFSIIDDNNGIPSTPVGIGGNAGFIGPFGELLVGEKNSDINESFQYDIINTEFDWEAPVTTGDGTVTATDSLMTVATVTNGTARIQTLDSVRYVTAQTGYHDFTCRFTGSTGFVEVGGYNGEDGFIVKWTASTNTLEFGYKKNGGDTTYETVTLPSDIKLGKLNVYRILWGYLGSANPILLVKKGTWRVLKIIQTEGELDGTHIGNPVLPFKCYVENGASADIGSVGGGTIGRDSERTRPFSFPFSALVNGTALEQGSFTLSGTNVGTGAIFNVKDTFGGKTNKIKSRFLIVTTSVVPISGTGSTQEVIFQIVKNPTLSGAPTYSDVNTTSSVFQYDHTPGTGASVTYVSGGTVIEQKLMTYTPGTTGRAAQTTLSSLDAETFGLIARAGDTFALIAKDRGGNNVTVRFRLVWEELF